MEPIDKFGRPIYPHIFRKLAQTGRKLQSLGYQESSQKPNLFECKYKQVAFYADMRGTDEIRIWEDTRPLFYWFFRNEMPELIVRQRMVQIEWMRLGSVRLRLATFQTREAIEERALIHDGGDEID